MSLINEALKKARDKNSPSSAPQPLHASTRPTGRSSPKSVGYGMWVVGALAVFGLVALLWLILRSTQTNNVATNQQAQQPLPAAQPKVPANTIEPPAAVPAVAPSQQIVQPSQPPVAPVVVTPPPQPVAPPPAPVQVQPPAQRLPRPSLRVQATMVFANSRAAIINGTEYSEGEEVEGATVVKIKLNGVRLRFNGEEYFLKSN